MARPVYEEHFGTPLEQRPEGHHLVAKVAARAMDEDQRRQVRILSCRHMDEVHPRAVDRDEFSGRRIAPLDQPRPDPRDADEDEKEREEECDRGVYEVHLADRL